MLCDEALKQPQCGTVESAGYPWMQRASTISVFAWPPVSTRPWTAQSVFAFPANEGPELITEAPLRAGEVHSNPPLRMREPCGQVTVSAFVSPGLTVTP